MQPEPEGSAGAGDDWGEVRPAKGSDLSGVALVSVSDLIVIKMIMRMTLMIMINMMMTMMIIIIIMVMMMMVRISVV